MYCEGNQKIRTKIYKIKIKSWISKIKRNILIAISYILLIVSVVVSIIVFVPIFFNRVPQYAYFFSEQAFPISYELIGSIVLIDSSANLPINKEVEIGIGGYNKRVMTSEQFNLRFSSNETEKVIIVVSFEYNNVVHQHIEVVEIKRKQHVIRRNIEINV